jgi:prevent-host-death family protein
MRTLGIRELRNRISEVLREVEVEGEIVEVTNHGRVVARLVPAHRPQLAPIEIEEIIADMDKVAAELGARWPSGVTAQDAIDDVRD